MRTSIFENEDGLAGVNSRSVVIELKGFTPQYSIYYTAESVLIKDTLQQMGWNVSLVVETSGGMLGYGQRTWLIYANVQNQYSDSEIPSYVRNDLSSVMTVVSARVLRGTSTNPTNPNGYASSDNPSGNDPLTWATRRVGEAASAAADSAIPTMFLVAGGVLAVLLIARR